MDSTSDNILADFQTLVEIVARLRGPDGCPWDREQTQKSLTQYVLEEAYELTEAIESNIQSEIKEELGDYLFQVILQAQVAKDEGHFELQDVLKNLSKKLIQRHPHVFKQSGSNIELKTSEEVWKNWHTIKEKESTEKQKPIFNYPKNLPALQASHKIGRKTEGYKFDWENYKQVLEKVYEEIKETEEAIEKNDPKSMKHEIGDLLFSVAQLARHIGIEPETALREANRRFTKRFNQVLTLANLPREEFSELSTAKKEDYWRQVKREEK